MIFELFLAFTILSCVLIFLGYYTKPEIKILAVLGFATLFFLGLLLQFNGVTIRNGSANSYSYLTNSTTVSTIATTYSYSVISDSTSQWIGRWLAIVSALGVALVLASNKIQEDD